MDVGGREGGRGAECQPIQGRGTLEDRTVEPDLESEGAGEGDLPRISKSPRRGEGSLPRNDGGPPAPIRGRNEGPGLRDLAETGGQLGGEGSSGLVRWERLILDEEGVIEEREEDDPGGGMKPLEGREWRGTREGDLARTPPSTPWRELRRWARLPLPGGPMRERF